jgi:hypothetical protein
MKTYGRAKVNLHALMSALYGNKSSTPSGHLATVENGDVFLRNKNALALKYVLFGVQ